MIRNIIKSIIKRTFPRFVLNKVLVSFSKLTVQKVFEQSPETPAYLEMDMLESLQKKYPSPPEYGYDPKSLEERGRSRTKELLSLIKSKKAKN